MFDKITYVAAAVWLRDANKFSVLLFAGLSIRYIIKSRAIEKE